MEISNETKARIFAQYLGCKINITNPGETEFLPLTENRLYYGMEFNRLGIDVQLLVKPLSSITEEDAVEVGKILISPHVVYHISKEDWLIKNTKYWLEYGLIAVYSSNAYQTLTAFQYLQSKGYALPYLGYSVEDLVKAGIYKLTQ